MVNGQEKIGYNQYDSYPDGHGLENLQWLRDMDRAELQRLAEEARVVDDKTPPTDDDKRRLAAVTNLGVSEQTDDDWYCLTRDTHGSIGEMLEVGYIMDWSQFPLDSLFCEWAYIVDLDAQTFEVYEGFQKKPHDKGRFAGRGGTDPQYFPVALAASWPLDKLPSDDEFLSMFKQDEEAEDEE